MRAGQQRSGAIHATPRLRLGARRPALAAHKVRAQQQKTKHEPVMFVRVSPAAGLGGRVCASPHFRCPASTKPLFRIKLGCTGTVYFVSYPRSPYIMCNGMQAKHRSCQPPPTIPQTPNIPPQRRYAARAHRSSRLPRPAKNDDSRQTRGLAALSSAAARHVHSPPPRLLLLLPLSLPPSPTL